MRNYICIFLVVCLPLTLASQTQHRFKVHVYVEGRNKQSINTIESHLKRELRLLGDVDIVGADDNWEHIIKIFVMDTEFKDGRKTGYVTIGSWNAYRLHTFFYANPESYKTMKATWGGNIGSAYYTHETLPVFCINHINDFDKNVLETSRAWRR